MPKNKPKALALGSFHRWAMKSFPPVIKGIKKNQRKKSTKKKQRRKKRMKRGKRRERKNEKNFLLLGWDYELLRGKRGKIWEKGFT